MYTKKMDLTAVTLFSLLYSEDRFVLIDFDWPNWIVEESMFRLHLTQ